MQNMRIGGKDFPIGDKTYIMGIMNVTPDSFSDGGRHHSPEEALKHTERMISEGADIIDIGGESTRPGYTMISEEEEIMRVIPVIKAIKQNFDIPVSIDTYKSKVAKAALQAGADMVNDIWGLKYDSDMADIIREYDAAVCIMHNRNNTYYKNYLEEIMSDLAVSIDIAAQAGIHGDKIMLDPGIGFGKTYETNLYLINHIEKLHQFGFPVLLGASRKSVVGLTLNLPVDERLEGSMATSVVAVMKGCQFVRVHDVKENLRAIRMTEAILCSDSLMPSCRPCSHFTED